MPIAIEPSSVWPAMVTPLDESGRPALAEIEKLVELFVRQRLGGLYVVGSTGQWPLLGLDQRRQVAAAVVKSAAGRIPIIVHVGAASTDDAVALARHAAEAGADAVSSVTPIYYAASPDVVFEHYRRIGEATSLPLYVYHLAGVSQGLDPRDYVERLLTIPHVAGMKITDRDLYQFGLIHSFAAGRLQLFSGADEVLCQAALSGAVAAIGTFYNLWGPACQSARRAFVAGGFEAGRKFMLAFQTAIWRVLHSQSTWTFMRSAMRLKYGIDIGMPRPPLGMLDKPWSDADVERLVAAVDDAAGLRGDT